MINIIGQESVKVFLESRKNNLPNALLFSGPEGSGKASAARELAKSIGYDLSEHYPDDGQYRVRQIRDILKIYRESDKLVFLLNDADLLHGPSAALILKSLEDTKQSIIFVLTAKESSQVIYTIYSRCVCLEFNSLKEEDIKEYLQVKYNIWNDHYAKISNGSFKMADDLASGSYLNNRNIVWSFLNEVKFINEDELAPPELLKENPELFVSIGLNLLYDVIKMSNGQSYSIINADLEDEYRNWLDRYSSDFAIFCIICFRDILRDIHKFYNLSLHLKTLILKLRLGSVPI